MLVRHWFDTLKSRLTRPLTRQQRRAAGRKAPEARHLRLETLEDRRLLAFDLAVNYPVGTSPQAIVSADFTNDGRPDLAVVNYSDSTVSVLVANALVPGSFDPAVTSPTGVNPLSLAVGDFDGDGNLDIATANAYDVSVMLGDGLGSFGPATSLGVPGNPQSVAVGDFNGDGLLDLGVSSNVYYPGFYYCGSYSCYYYHPGHNEGYANVLLGNGAGGFAAANSTFIDSASVNSALAADLN